MGKTDGFYANQIIELINRNTKKERIQIGRIDLMQNFSFFEVAEQQADIVIKALNKVTLKGKRIIVSSSMTMILQIRDSTMPEWARRKRKNKSS